MNTGTVVVICTVIGTVLGVVGFLLKVRDTAHKQAEAEAREKLEIRGAAFADGARSRDDEIRLITSERDMARREADQLRADLTLERNRRRS